MTEDQIARRKASIDAYKARNREKLLEKARAAYWADTEKAKLRSAAYHAKHPDRVKAKRLEYRAKHREEMNLNDAARRKANPEITRIQNANYRAQHKEELREKAKVYKLVNPDIVKNRKTANYKKNRTSILEYAKAYQLKNIDRIKARQSAYRAENPEKGRIHCQNRRAKRAEVGGRLSAGISEKLFKLQKGKCPCCNQPLGDDYHLDHKMPLALGGVNEDGNMQLLRQRCNNQKGAKHPVDFMQLRGFLL